MSPGSGVDEGAGRRATTVPLVRSTVSPVVGSPSRSGGPTCRAVTPPNGPEGSRPQPPATLNASSEGAEVALAGHARSSLRSISPFVLCAVAFRVSVRSRSGMSEAVTPVSGACTWIQPRDARLPNVAWTGRPVAPNRSASSDASRPELYTHSDSACGRPGIGAPSGSPLISSPISWLRGWPARSDRHHAMLGSVYGSTPSTVVETSDRPGRPSSRYSSDDPTCPGAADTAPSTTDGPVPKPNHVRTSLPVE